MFFLFLGMKTLEIYPVSNIQPLQTNMNRTQGTKNNIL